MVNISTLLPIPDRYITFQPHDSKFRCEVCCGRPMKDYLAHISADNHKRSIAHFIDQQKAQQEMLPGLHSTADRELSPFLHPVTPPEYRRSPSPPPPASPIMPLSPLTNLRRLLSGIQDDDATSSDSDSSNNPMSFHNLKQALETLAALEEEDVDEFEEEEPELEETSNIDDMNGWYPFKRKELYTAMGLRRPQGSSGDALYTCGTAHYSAELHRRLSEVQVSDVTCAQWNEAINSGIKTWEERPVCPPKPRARATQAKGSKQSKRGRHNVPPETIDSDQSDD
ncbi:uncharacterized protein MELLADRAFT_107278 [Melampsora larici-populina 98AG31]|uniref:Uncharacterized protein n=1 Tax=Melampsora larici-populina (strain 98AG31 / pathotype 3-4-7) TaxID=747676 RepID=F4RNT3_MELLP|nr:uncharacterized protein MELLADRAFT_107278 [Melampsora larici-populina 98AG31]EGG05856.1 hypothetical protein MELLADRAFT_107278 [Melampsora larici-populina 98AG31]